MCRNFLGIWLLALGALSTASLACAEQIGEVSQQEYRGALGIAPGQTGAEQLLFKHPVHANERVQTQDGGTVLRLADATRLAIDAHSSLLLDRFVYDPETVSRNGALKITVGLLRFTSGLKPHQGDMAIETPVSVLSIRGTDVVVKVDHDGMTIVDLLQGIVEVRSCGKKTTIRAGQSVKIRPGCLPILVANMPLITPSAFLAADLAAFPPAGESSQAATRDAQIGQHGAGDSDTDGSGGVAGSNSDSGGTSGDSSGSGSGSGGDSGGGGTGGESGGKPGHGNGDGNHTHDGPPGLK